MSEQSTDPSLTDPQEVARGCRRIVGFVVVGWIGASLLLAFVRDQGGGGVVARTVDIAIPFLLAGFVFFAIARRVRRNRRRDEGAPQVPEKTRPALPGDSGKPRPRPPRPTRSMPKPAPPEPLEAPPQSLEEALRDLENEAIETGPDLAMPEDEPRPRTSSEMIDEARRKWGTDRGPKKE